MGDDFFRTVMGHRFYNSTMPEIATQLKRLADGIEKQNSALAEIIELGRLPLLEMTARIKLGTIS